METEQNDQTKGSPDAVVQELLNRTAANAISDDMRGTILNVAFTNYPEGFSQARRILPETRDAIVAGIEQRREEFNGKATSLIETLRGFRLDIQG